MTRTDSTEDGPSLGAGNEMSIAAIIILFILLLLFLWWWFTRGSNRPAEASSEAHYASGWSVKSNADWTPFPPNANPLGPPDSSCTGGVIAGSWAHFTFSSFTLPASATVVGILLRVKYKSPSGSNTVQLTDGGTLVGTSTSIASVSGSSGCAGTTFTSVGSDTDMWGSTLSAADFAAGAVGVRLTQNANTVDIDAVELTVYSTS